MAYGLKIPQHKAEELKLRYGTVLSSTIDSVAAVKLDDRHYNANFISQILEYRARELFEYVRDSLEATGDEGPVPGGVVLTGGGSLLDGMTELAEDILGYARQNRVPRRVKGEVKPVQQTSVCNVCRSAILLGQKR